MWDADERGRGELFPHTDDIFLVVEEGRRLVFTNAIDSEWRPAPPAPVAITAEIVFGDHPEGTEYRVIVRHGDADADARALHEELGFMEGWGAVSGALVSVAEAQAASS
ncbi:MAG: SRPBCC domain-containing protein [Leucobacter sp.]